MCREFVAAHLSANIRFCRLSMLFKFQQYTSTSYNNCQLLINSVAVRFILNYNRISGHQ